MTYQWDTRRRRYLDSNGKVVPVSRVVAARDSLVRGNVTSATNLADQVISGAIPISRFVTLMRGMVKDATLGEYMLGRGGRAQMTPADRGRVGGLLRAQYRYLDQFGVDIANGELSADQIRNRATLYAESARGTYERGYASAWGISLPTYPGQQACTVRCKCRWKIEEKRSLKEIHATWIRDRGAQSCEDCIGNASQYAPLIFPME